MSKPKIIIAIKDGVLDNVLTNIREDIDIDIEVTYLSSLTSYECLDKEIERKQNGFREIY